MIRAASLRGFGPLVEELGGDAEELLLRFGLAAATVAEDSPERAPRSQRCSGSVRRDAAHRYITTTNLPMTQVAALAGFSEQSSLSHAVRRWFGMSPRELRDTIFA